MLEKVVNVLDQGADPGGVHDSTEAFRKALELSSGIDVPKGVYRLSGVLEFGDAAPVPDVDHQVDALD